jgi:crossover junction endodeoxyribonuclease RuvC
MLIEMDATDGLAAALCHFYQSDISTGDTKYKNWKDFANHNPEKVKK